VSGLEIGPATRKTRNPSCRWQTLATLEIRSTGHSRASNMTLFDSLPIWFPISVLYSNCVCKMDRFGDIRLLKLPWPWNPGQWSIKVIGNDTIRQIVYNFLLMFNSNYGSISQRFRDIWRQRIQWPWNPGQGHSRSSKVTPVDSLHMISYYHPIVTLCLECTVFEILRHIGRKSPKNLPHRHLTPLPSEPPGISCQVSLYLQ